MVNRGSSVVTTQLLVSSKAPADDSYPIRTRTFLSQNQIDFTGMFGYHMYDFVVQSTRRAAQFCA